MVMFHEQFRECFYRVEQRILGQVYLQGLLSKILRKNVEAIALEYLGDTRVRALQKFITNYRWYDTVMLSKANGMLSDLVATEEGMITLDGSDIAKKGKESVGVARQYCGNTGKFPARWVGFDASFGSDGEFRDAVDSLQMNYLGDHCCPNV